MPATEYVRARPVIPLLEIKMGMKTCSEAPGVGTFERGVHPPEGKHLAEAAHIEVMPTPDSVVLPLLQHTGAPCEPLVKPKQSVTLGEKIAQADAFVSAPIHAPITGTVGPLSVTTLPNGRHVRTIPVTAQDEQLSGVALWDDIYGGDWSYDQVSRHQPADITKAVKEAGLVGLGGAAFPTHVKLSPNPDKPVDTLLLNGCECEPYLTSDHRLMVEAPTAIVLGALLSAKACGAKRIFVAIESNKPDAAKALQEAAKGTDVKVAVVETKYPMGGERQVVPAVLKRVVPTGGLPLDVGVVVMNVATSAAVARAVVRGKPLTHRVVSVTGDGIKQPKNLLVAIGTPYQSLIDYCGGLKASAARVIAGGPMMGFALGNLATPVTKGTSGVVVLTHQDVKREQETACVRCGRCVDACPLQLVPTKLALSSRHKDWDLARKYHIAACCECGSCSYVCPARIPLVQLIRVGKAASR